MDIMDYLIEFHKDADRQGPGSDEATKKALLYIPELDEDSCCRYAARVFE